MMNIHAHRHLCIALLALAAGATACASSTAKYRDASGDIASSLTKQVQKRTDPRLLRVVVYEFSPCAAPSRRGMTMKQGGHTAREFASQIKHQLITALAQRMVVVEGDALQRRTGRGSLLAAIGTDERSPTPYPEAESLGANAVLVGNYFVDGDKSVVVMARLVDVRTNEILATAEETISRVDLPHEHR